MKIKYNFVPKKDVNFCLETFTVKEAYEHLKKTGYRCVPVLDETKTFFRGLIYKVHILEFLYENNGKEDETIEDIIRDKDAFKYEDDSFFKAFFTIERLPFLAILNESNHFVGILTHKNVMNVLEDSFGMQTGGYSLTISAHEKKGALRDIFSILKGVNILGVLTLDNADTYLRRVIVTLPQEISKNDLDKIVKKLESKDYRVPYIDEIERRD